MNRLLFFRKSLSLTQKEIANTLGITQSAYSALESGRNTLTDRNAELLSNKFKINKEWLLTGFGDIRAGQEDESIDAEIDAVVQKMMSEGQTIGGSVPYEFVQQLFRERETHDQLVLSQQKIIDSQQQTIEQLTMLLNKKQL